MPEPAKERLVHGHGGVGTSAEPAAGQPRCRPGGRRKRHSTSVEPRSFPPSSSPARISASTVSSAERGRKLTKAPSPSSPAVRSMRSRNAATWIGTGEGGGCSSRKRPSPARSPARAARRKAMASRTRVRGLSKVKPFQRKVKPFQRSTITLEEEPMPRQKRPALASWRAAACWASTAGPRVNTVHHSGAEAHGLGPRRSHRERVKPSWPPVSPLHASV